MHHFIYPTQDTFISSIYNSSNFGLNEILRVGVENVETKVVNSTQAFPISSSVSNFCVSNFSGSILSAELYGTSSNTTASILSLVISNVTASHFNGVLTGSYSSASVTGSITGSLVNFSGSFSGIYSGSLLGYFLSDFIPYFNGSTTNFTGKILSGYIFGYQILNQQNVVVSTNLYKNRALLQFDVSSISSSVSSGDIVSPRFTLKMKVARAENLPIRYSLFAYPVVESWEMGDGYFFDGGSTRGASWIFRNGEDDTPWNTTGSTYVSTPAASQSFDYETGDVSMDVTNIANAWISGSIPNDGLVILSSEETSPTGSGMSLYFFSKDTNTIYSPYLDVGWGDFSIVTGSVSTGSVVISSSYAGLLATVSDTASISNSSITGSIFGVMNININSNNSASGTITAQGKGGTVNGDAIFGHVSGSIFFDMTVINHLWPGFGPSFNLTSTDYNSYIGNYGYFPFVTTTTITSTPVTFSIITARILDGLFSGSLFTASVTNNNVQFIGGITGSWNPAILNTVQLSSSFPFLNFPSTVTVNLSSPYIYGSAYGEFTYVAFTQSGIFNGTIVSGPLIGAKVNLPFSGSFATSSQSFTSSVTFVSHSLEPMQVSTPFITVVRIPEKVKTNEIIKVRVFGRQQYPLKNFQRLTQFSQFLTPLYLPSTSYYAIKDNETEEIILDFDNYTQISCDEQGSYFMLDTSGLPQERYVKFLIKVEQSGSVYVSDHSDIFKVVR